MSFFNALFKKRKPDYIIFPKIEISESNKSITLLGFVRNNRKRNILCDFFYDRRWYNTPSKGDKKNLLNWCKAIKTKLRKNGYSVEIKKIKIIEPISL